VVQLNTLNTDASLDSAARNSVHFPLWLNAVQRKPADEAKWSQHELQADPTVRGILRSLTESVPVEYMNHEARWQAAARESTRAP
jgi:hypothetical protein